MSNADAGSTPDADRTHCDQCQFPLEDHGVMFVDGTTTQKVFICPARMCRPPAKGD